jgi:hypothetical protein
VGLQGQLRAELAVAHARAHRVAAGRQLPGPDRHRGVGEGVDAHGRWRAHGVAAEADLDLRPGLGGGPPGDRDPRRPRGLGAGRHLGAMRDQEAGPRVLTGGDQVEGRGAQPVRLARGHGARDVDRRRPRLALAARLAPAGVSDRGDRDEKHEEQGRAHDRSTASAAHGCSR